MRMANRLPSKVFLAALLALILFTEAQAADPAFCRQYAKAAVNQVRGGLSDPACGGRLQGTRWSSDFAAHYEWCLGTSVAATEGERDARTRYLRGCSGR
jgi:hypothetical protein